MAPGKLRSLTPRMAPTGSLGERLAGLRLRDYGDLQPERDWESLARKVERQAQSALRHPLALFLGGDHSVTIPLARAFSRVHPGQLGYIQLDAHPDLEDEFEGSRWSHACTARRVLELPGFSHRRCAIVGVRSFLPRELDFLASHPELKPIPARQFGLQAAERIGEEVVEHLAGAEAVYLSLDIDVLDPAHAPGTGTPEAGGITSRELLVLIRILVEKLPVRALDVVEVSPPLDASDITAFAALKAIYEALAAFQEREEKTLS